MVEVEEAVRKRKRTGDLVVVLASVCFENCDAEQEDWTNGEKKGDVVFDDEACKDVNAL